MLNSLRTLVVKSWSSKFITFPLQRTLSADNVLWSGKVINLEDHDLTTNVLREFNKSVNNDNRVETILLPIRDGISIIRKI